MRNAPSVSYPVGRSVFYAGLLAGCGSLSLALVIWVAPSVGWQTAVGGSILWIAWALLAFASWLRAPVGRLRWDALAMHPGALLQSPGAWSWQSAAYQDGVPLLKVERVQDLQRWILLRLHNPDGARSWVWVERARYPAKWDDLRRAVVAHGAAP